MPGNRDGDILVPQAADALERLKLEVARQVGWNVTSEADLRRQLDQAKYRVAAEAGIPFQEGYNGDLPSRLNGAIGGRLGGRIGGQMVKRMLQLAESQLANQPQPRI